jgi:PAS domain S-box-containing protein
MTHRAAPSARLLDGMVDTSGRDGWPALFTAAFRQSSNAMALVDDRRRHVDVNGPYLNLLGYSRAVLVGRPIFEIVAGGPLATEEEWEAALRAGNFAGRAELVCADGATVSVDWGAHVVVATGHRLALLVALSTSRRSLRRAASSKSDAPALSPRELEIVELVALGYSGPEIAQKLHISHETVRTHVRNAMVKTGARSRAHLVAKALADGAIAL